jgi:tetratricopeptide (TPR) repeat protein
MTLKTLWSTVKRSPRAPTQVEMFRAASRERDAGHFDVALDLVTRGLAAAPESIVGHMLAGNLQLATRAMAPAREAFEHVLSLDPHQPRALLGLARIAFEEQDAEACRAFLERAIGRYPDFPEAQALLGVLTAPARAASAIPSARALVLPDCARALVLVGADGAPLASLPDAGTDAAAGRVHRVTRLAGAILEHAGLGGLRAGVIEDGAETMLLRATDAATLSMTFAGDLSVDTAQAEMDRLWMLANTDGGEAPA